MPPPHSLRSQARSGAPQGQQVITLMAVREIQREIQRQSERRAAAAAVSRAVEVLVLDCMLIAC